MTTALIYVFPNQLKYESLAQRFADKYVEHPPGETECVLHVVVNGGGKITPGQERLFHPFRPKFLYHDNSAKDLGAYLMAARMIDCDLMVCLGAPVRPCRAGWLDMIVSAVENNGPGLYGPWGAHAPTTHLSTTAFAIAPEILKTYPYPVKNETRYQFEHGPQSITAFTRKQGFPVMQVTARGVFRVEHFHVPDRSETLLLGQVTAHYGFED